MSARVGDLEVRGIATILTTIPGPYVCSTHSIDGSAWVRLPGSKRDPHIQVTRPVDGSFLLHYAVGGWIREYSWFEVSGAAVNADPDSRDEPAYLDEGCVVLPAGRHPIGGKHWSGIVEMPALVCVRVFSGSGGGGKVGPSEFRYEIDPSRFTGVGASTDEARQETPKAVRATAMHGQRFALQATRDDGARVSISLESPERPLDFHVSITTQ
jgi:hypothetical protein